MDITFPRQIIGMEKARYQMVAGLQGKGICSSSVLNVMLQVPRHLFVSEALRYRAYDDISLPIGFGQTISRPFVIANMVQALGLTGDERVLEIGTGSGYQTSILAYLSQSVVTIERIDQLYKRARDVLFDLKYSNIHFIHSGDFNTASGVFDAIIVAAGADILPVDLFEKLAVGGVLTVPVSNGDGHIIKRYLKKNSDSFIDDTIGEATFVPLIL